MAMPGLSGASDRPQLAQSPGDGLGVVNSTRYENLDTSLPIKVLALDDTNHNLRLRDEMIVRLEGASYGLSDQADLELSFDTEVVQGHFESAQPSLGKLEAGTNTGVGRRSTDTGVDVEVNVWSSTQDSVLGGRKSAGGKRVVSQFRIFAILQDLRSGTRLWEGDVRAPLGQSDPERLSRSMIAPLIEALGRTVKHEPVELR